MGRTRERCWEDGGEELEGPEGISMCVRAVADGTRCMDLLDLDAYGFML